MELLAYSARDRMLHNGIDNMRLNTTRLDLTIERILKLRRISMQFTKHWQRPFNYILADVDIIFVRIYNFFYQA